MATSGSGEFGCSFRLAMPSKTSHSVPLGTEPHVNRCNSPGKSIHNVIELSVLGISLLMLLSCGLVGFFYLCGLFFMSCHDYCVK